MFFNEEDNVTTIEVEKDTTNIQSSEMPDQDADVEDLDMESVDLDFDELKKNGYAPNVEGYSSKEGIDLSYDVLNNQTTSDDSIHDRTSKYSGWIDTSAVDLDLDLEDTCTEDDIQCESVSPITFSESNVRIFQREDKNIIMESDLEAVKYYYNNTLSESEILTTIADYHNLSEDSIYVMINEASNVKDVVKKKVKPVKDAIDKQIEMLNGKKAKVAPDIWKKSPDCLRLKQLRAKKALASK